MSCDRIRNSAVTSRVAGFREALAPFSQAGEKSMEEISTDGRRALLALASSWAIPGAPGSCYEPAVSQAGTRLPDRLPVSIGRG